MSSGRIEIVDVVVTRPGVEGTVLTILGRPCYRVTRQEWIPENWQGNGLPRRYILTAQGIPEEEKP